MPYYTPGFNASVDGIAAAGTFIAFHTADPAGVAGASQSGTRYVTAWGAASAGSRVGTQVAAAIAGGQTIGWWSVNSLSTAGTMLFSAALAASEAFGSAGTYNFTPTINATN